MDFLDYAQMTTGQKIVYKIGAFFRGIPGAIGHLVAVIGNFFKSIFTAIGNGFVGYGSRFKNGDIGTKLSYIVMGAGNMMHKQFAKGILFLAAEVAYIVFMFSFGFVYISKIYCNGVDLGDGRGPIDGAIGHVIQATGADSSSGFVSNSFNKPVIDNSNNVLLFFVLTLIVTIAFFAIYIANTKSAYASQQLIERGKNPVGFFEEVKDFLDERFHVTLLFVPSVLLLIFTVLPIIFTIFIAFTSYNKQADPNAEKIYWWVGFENFKEVFASTAGTSETFGKILVWTLVWAVFATFSNYILGIVLALMINKKTIKFKGFWRTAFVITAAVPQFVTLLVMRCLLFVDGPINQLITGLGGSAINFLGDMGGFWPRFTVIVVNMWVGIPYTMLISSGLLMNIPEDLYESARIDGANAFQQFTKITFPYIFFVTTPYLITTFVGNINNFNVIYYLTTGGPNPRGYTNGAGQTDLLVTWLYKLTVDEKDYNLGAVIGIIVFVICAAGSLITFNMSKASKNEEEFS